MDHTVLSRLSTYGMSHAAFTPEPHSITTLWPVLIFRPAEGRRLSWPGWLGEIPRWFARPKCLMAAATIIITTDRLIVGTESIAVARESGDVIDELTSEVRLELCQPAGRVAHLLLQVVPTVAQRVDTLRLVAGHAHLQLLQKTVRLLQHTRTYMYGVNGISVDLF